MHSFMQTVCTRHAPVRHACTRLLVWVLFSKNWVEANFCLDKDKETYQRGTTANLTQMHGTCPRGCQQLCFRAWMHAEPHFVPCQHTRRRHDLDKHKQPGTNKTVTNFYSLTVVARESVLVRSVRANGLTDSHAIPTRAHFHRPPVCMCVLAHASPARCWPGLKRSPFGRV